MNIQELHDLLEDMMARGQNPLSEIEIVIEDKNAIGSTPAVRVSSVVQGFDWNHGRVLIQPDRKLKRA